MACFTCAAARYAGMASENKCNGFFANTVYSRSGRREQDRKRRCPININGNRSTHTSACISSPMDTGASQTQLALLQRLFGAIRLKAVQVVGFQPASMPEVLLAGQVCAFLLFCSCLFLQRTRQIAKRKSAQWRRHLFAQRDHFE